MNFWKLPFTTKESWKNDRERGVGFISVHLHKRRTFSLKSWTVRNSLLEHLSSCWKNNFCPIQIQNLFVNANHGQGQSPSGRFGKALVLLELAFESWGGHSFLLLRFFGKDLPRFTTLVLFWSRKRLFVQCQPRYSNQKSNLSRWTLKCARKVRPYPNARYDHILR